MQKQFEELQDKLASEFSKKRKIKQDYEDQIQEINDDLQYFKDKYSEMKDLLNSCREQLKQFEELNLMRNNVIEKLENENKNLKNQNMINLNVVVPNQLSQYMTQTPSKQ